MSPNRGTGKVEDNGVVLPILPATGRGRFFSRLRNVRYLAVNLSTSMQGVNVLVTGVKLPVSYYS